MGWLRAVARELWGLFVDDGSFAASILVWVAIALVRARVAAGAWWVGVALFVGLAAVMVESAVRFARRR